MYFSTMDTSEDRCRARLAEETFRITDNDTEKLTEAASSGRRKWSKMETGLVQALVVCACVILILAGLLIVQHFVLSEYKTCQSLECVEVAGSVIAAMDASVDPCQDFHQYACGNWLHTTVPPPSAGKWSAFTVVQDKNDAIVKRLLEEPGEIYLNKNSTAVQKAKQFFQTCMNMTSIDDNGATPMLELIKDLGSWPVTSDATSGTWDAASWDLADTLVMLYPYVADYGALFTFGISVDERNNSNYILSFDQPSLLYKNTKFYTGNDSQSYHQAEVNFFVDFAKALGATGDVNSWAETVWQFKHDLAMIMAPKEQRLDPNDLYNPMTLQELQNLTGNWIDLSAYVDAVFHNHSDHIPMTTRVIVNDVEYWRRLGDIVNNTPEETLATYLMWHILPGWWKVLPQSFQEAYRRWNQFLYGTDALRERWQTCLIITDSGFPEVTGGLYANYVTNTQQRRQVEEILSKVVDTFYARLPKVTWMDTATLHRAVDKVLAITQKISFPDITLAPAKLDKLYENMVTTDNAFQNRINYYVYSSDELLAKLGTPVDRERWAMSAMETNAYYSPSFNEMVFPAGILRRVFYDPTYPMAMNFGAIGMVMGHELTHGFDSTGRHYDESGNMADWWSAESDQAFQTHTDCLVQQYSAFTIGEHAHVNGLTTLGENIADNGGLKTAYYAYKNWLSDNDYQDARALLPGLNMTAEQLFFTAFAQIWCVHETQEHMEHVIDTDPHTHSAYRVRGVVSNMEEFSEAFNCPANAPMNPKDKCVVW